MKADAFDGVRIQRLDWSELQFETGADGEAVVLGRGGNGQVTQARWGGTQVDVKQLHLSQQQDVSGREVHAAESSFLSEAVAAWDLVHPRINPMLAIAMDKSDPARTRYGLVMQYAAGGSVRTVLSDREDIRIPFIQRLKWICQAIAEGLDYMHRSG